MGAFARATGPHFCSSARLLPPCLVPLVERLSNTSTAVAAAAEASLASVCQSGGFASLRGLLSANADFVVDRVCYRLRAGGRDAAALLAALLGPCNAGAELLPLLGEPASAAIRGVSVRARAMEPESAGLFLEALVHVARAVEAEAGAVRDEAEKERPTRAGSEPGTREEHALPPRPVPGPDAPLPEAPRPRPAAAADDGARKMILEKIERRHNRALSAATLASAVLESCAPLVVADRPRACVASLDACECALRAIAAAAAAKEADEDATSAAGGRDPLTPPLPDLPQLLPAVHSLWHPLASALRGASVPCLERCLSCLAALPAASDGAFLARRFATDAWPALRSLLRDGRPLAPAAPRPARERKRERQALLSPEDIARDRPASSLSTAARGAIEALALTDAPRDGRGGGADESPESASRLRAAAASCIASLCDSPKGRASLRLVAPRALDALLPACAPSLPPHVREAASRALLSLARTDPYASWALFSDVALASSDPPPELALPGRGPVLGGAAERTSGTTARALRFLEWSAAPCPVPRDGRSSRRASALAASRAAEADARRGAGGWESGGGGEVPDLDRELANAVGEGPSKGDSLEEGPWEWPVARVARGWAAARLAGASEARMLRVLPSCRDLLPRVAGKREEASRLGRLVADAAASGVGGVARRGCELGCGREGEMAEAC